jgi:hypothetical protein
MKRAITFFVFIILLLSCNKEKNTSHLIGEWVEEAVYGQTNNGFEWSQISGIYDYIYLKEDGNYIYGNSRCGNGTSGGVYQFNYPERLLMLGDYSFTSVKNYKIEIIDENHFILENPHTENIYNLRMKFKREKY